MSPETNLLQDLLRRARSRRQLLLSLRIGALLMVLTTVYFALIRPLFKRISDARLARLIEEHSPGTEDRLVTAVEYSNGNAQSHLSPALVNRLDKDGNSVSGMLDVGE